MQEWKMTDKNYRVWKMQDWKMTDNIDEQQQQPSGPATSATTAADATSARSATCEVCLLAPRDGVVMVPCGHSSFCAQCADAVAVMPNGCPLCRTPIDMVMRV